MTEVGGWDGDAYDSGFRERAESGEDVHGEARLVRRLAEPRTALDAGCGTGRVAIELSRHGIRTVGIDLDAGMLAVARRNAPELDWRLGDLSVIHIDGPGGVRMQFDVVVAAGNVMIFVARGSEGRVLGNLAQHLAPEGLLVAGFQLLPGGLDLPEFDGLAAAVGLELVHRWSTWDGHALSPGGDYAVSVHRRREHSARPASLGVVAARRLRSRRDRAADPRHVNFVQGQSARLEQRPQRPSLRAGDRAQSRGRTGPSATPRFASKIRSS